MGKLVGYARVSTEEQNVDLQLDSLREAGCCDKLIFIDRVSGARSKRPDLDACIDALKPGDTLLVWRLGRSVRHLVTLIQERTNAGLSAARARGRKGDRKPIRGNDPRVKTACRMHRDHELSVKQICKTLDISRATLYRYPAVVNDPTPAP